MVPSLLLISPFNSLYWDFCFASSQQAPSLSAGLLTFNSLYWDFCFASDEWGFRKINGLLDFQFPLLGFLLCIFSWKVEWMASHGLSIPFIGIFALHLIGQLVGAILKPIYFQFPLLGFLLCIMCYLEDLCQIMPFFQFPLLGFLLCILGITAPRL